MYQLGKRKRSRRRFRQTVIAAAIAMFTALTVLGFYKLLHLHAHANATISNAAAHTTAYRTTSAKVHIDEPLFTMDLPAGWQPHKAVTDIYAPTYSFRSNGEQIQILSIYIDAIPSGLAVNRVIVVDSQGSGISHEVVSDNCTNFTNPTAEERQKGIADGKWQGTSFLCDVGNYERDVVGITSEAGINEIPLTGPKAGTHKVFITYTDNAINPDFGVFYDILDSFKLK